MEVYCGVYDFNLNLIVPVSAQIISEESFAELDSKEVFYFGDGAEKCQGMLTQPNFTRLDSIFPSAIDLGMLAKLKFELSEFEDVAYFEPFYLKDFLATTPKKLL